MTVSKIFGWSVLATASWLAVGCGGGGGDAPLADLGTSSSDGVQLTVEQTAFAAGSGYSLIQRSNGTVATVGSGTVGSSNTLIQNRALSVAQWAEGRGASFALDESGGIRYWGYDRAGTSSLTPRLLSGLGKSVAVRACGSGNAAMVYSLRSDGSIWAIPGTSISERAQGFPVSGIDNAVALSDGGDDACTGMLAIKKDGTVNQLAARGAADPAAIPDSAVAVGIIGVLEATQASCARDNCLVVNKAGEVYGWGSNDAAQLGMGDKTARWSPVNTGIDKQVGPVQQVFVTMSGAAYAITRSGALYGWGNLDVNDLGANSSPVQILSSGAVRLTASPSASSGHTLVQMSDGRVMGWGKNDRGQIDASGAPTIKLPTELAIRVK